MLYGLIGYPIAHSKSPELFSNIWANEGRTDCEYRLFPMDRLDQFSSLLEEHKDLRGLNVTLPYKKLILPYCDVLSDEVRQIGAANTLKLESGHHWVRISAFNTDMAGFRKSLVNWLPVLPKSAIILGSGGAAAAVAFALGQLGMPYYIVSRNVVENGITWETLSPDLIKETELIVNATPLGMYPKTATFPDIPWEAIGKSHKLYDLVYNPQLTQFLQRGVMRGAEVKSGMEMLRLQAKETWDIWNAKN